jgi:hypothetical protein
MSHEASANQSKAAVRQIHGSHARYKTDGAQRTSGCVTSDDEDQAGRVTRSFIENAAIPNILTGSDPKETFETTREVALVRVSNGQCR